MKRIIAIGGGEIREKTTLKIDEYIAGLAKEHAGDKRANALFIPTASHDFMPYYNSFHKIYTGTFDIKTDVALTVFREPDMEKLKEKFLKADLIYVGGGDTVFMIEHWKQSGLLSLIKEAYERGVISGAVRRRDLLVFGYLHGFLKVGRWYEVCDVQRIKLDKRNNFSTLWAKNA